LDVTIDSVPIPLFWDWIAALEYLSFLETTIHKEEIMNIQSNWKLLVGATLLALAVGCASVPPRELVQRNDHASLTAWYQEEARELRMRAEEMRQMGKEYEIYTPKQGQQSILVQHCRNLEGKYTKAAEELDALAKLHAEERKIP
jgi:hypothetical protein